MAVNKNFVVKNGLEVNTNLIVADAISDQIGIGTTAPQYTVDIKGGIGVTSVYVAGVTTIRDKLRVGAGGTVFSVIAGPTGETAVGVGTTSPSFLLDVRSPVSTGQTALYVQGDVRITGDLNVDDITFDDATIQDLTVTQNVFLNSISGITTINGPVGLSSNLTVSGITTIDGSVGLSSNLTVSGITTLASSGGITTTGGDFYVGGDLYVLDDITIDEFNGRNINLSGIATLGTVQISSGIVTATTGIVTYYGDGSYLTGAAPGLSAAIGISSGGTQIGSGITMVDFTATNATITVAAGSATPAGIATVNIQPSVSLGLVIALGG